MRRRVEENLVAYGFLSAALVCFAVFSWHPIARVLLLLYRYAFYYNDFGAASALSLLLLLVLGAFTALYLRVTRKADA
jgi:hypothetical protein